MHGKVVSVGLSRAHAFSKELTDKISLVAGIGVEGDAHAGVTVKHRSRVVQDPTQPNLRQVHLIHSELHDELRDAGYSVQPGELGENITTRGINLLELPTDALLYIGNSAVIRVTGLRNPCDQIDNFMPGLLKQVLSRDDNGNLIRKTGIMAVVLESGVVCPGDSIVVRLPRAPYRRLERV